MHNLKSTILTICKYIIKWHYVAFTVLYNYTIHIQNFSPSQTETLYPLSTNFHSTSPAPSSHHSIFYV